jgi:hypothetical protein
VRGDRVIVRQETTVGGGTVLDPAPPRHADEARMRALESGGVVHAPERADDLRRRGLLADELVCAGDWAFSASWLAALKDDVDEQLARRVDEPDPGLPASVLLGNAPWTFVVAPLLGLEAAGGKLHLPGTKPSTSGRGDEVQRLVAGAGLEPVSAGDAGLAAQLEREGKLVRLGDGLVVSPEAYERAKAVLVEECERAGTISLGRYRDLLGSSRRVTQLLLERFDADRVTLRVGDVRRLRRATARS